VKFDLKLIGVCLIIQTLFLEYGCKKRNDPIDSDNNSPTNMQLVDTLNIIASTVSEPFVRTDQLQQYLAGRMHDPLTGVSESTIFTEIRLSSTGTVVDLGSGVDSAFLFLSFTSKTEFKAWYGNLASNQELQVFEISEAFDPSASKAYTSVDSLQLFPTPIGSFFGAFKLDDSLRIFNNGNFVNIVPGIKVALTKEFAEKLLSAGPNEVSTNANFKNYIKGICIKPLNNPASGEGAVVAFNLNIDPTRISVYYDNDKQVNFLITQEDRKFARYSFSNQSPNIIAQKLNPDQHYDTTYVQGLTGAKTQLRFPSLYSLIEDGNIMIHKVELVIPVIKNTISENYFAPRRLLVVQPDIQNQNSNLQIQDFLLGGASYGGVYDADKGEYRFGITQYIQTILKTKQRGDDFNNGLYIIPTLDLPIAPSRVLLDSDRTNRPPNERLRLIILYSKL
jgi:hypothetical protein